MTETSHICPHCGKEMSKWESPVESNWGGGAKFVCFDDECPYYVRGWKWMEEKFGRKASYRHSIDAETGRPSPLPVATPNHLKPGIVE